MESLISAVFSRPAIWDSSVKNHSDRDIIQKLWNEIAEELNCEGNNNESYFINIEFIY